METKKTPKASVKNKRTDFFLIGLALSILLVFGAFNYKVYDETKKEVEEIINQVNKRRLAFIDTKSINDQARELLN